MSESKTKEELTVESVIMELEEYSGQAFVGPPRAYFEIPCGMEGIARGVYRVYVVQAPTMMEALSGLRACVKEQIDKSRWHMNLTCLVWRLPEKIEVEQMEGEPSWRARSRLTVLPEENMQ